MPPAFLFFSSADLPNLKALKGSAHLLPVKANTTMGDSENGYFTLSDEAVDASFRHIQQLCNLILL
jgi:hypothetical protein